MYFRREVFADGVVSRQEAEAIFAINSAITEKCEEWGVFFVEALTDHLVMQVEPRGYLTVDDASWLIDMVCQDGHVEAATEIELLVRILSKSSQTPEIFVGFVLSEIGRAVINGVGPLARGGRLTPGVIGESEVELIRHVLYAYGGEAGISISKTEAEFLFLLNDRTDEQRNHPNWRELYVKAIANYLMSAATYNAPSRTDAVAREAWLADRQTDVASTLKRSFTGLSEVFSRGFFDGIFDDAHTQVEKAWRIRNERQSAAEEAAREIDASESKWLVDKLLEDGIVSENERSLLDRLFLESGNRHQDLAPLLDQKSTAG